jgi:hypothetical protein
MKKLCIIALIMLMGLVALLTGCEDRGRGVPTRVDIPTWSLDPTNRVFSTDTSRMGAPGIFPEADLLVQVGNPFAILKTEVYIPRVALEPPVSRVPTLILLSPQHEVGSNSDWYYFERGLFQLAEEMIATGEIQPMMIVAVGNNETFGGNWYGNSYAAGFYDHLLGVELIRRLEQNFPQTFDPAQGKLGIGGFDQGAYGAFRAAIQNPGVFGSISACDGPLDFDGGAGFGNGLEALIPQVFTELGLTETNFRSEFDSSGASQAGRLFIGGALAFSPHDTALSYSLFLGQQPVGVTILARDSIESPATFVTRVVQPDTRGVEFDFHLPFDSTAQLDPEIWDLWLNNDLERLHDNSSFAQPLTGLDLYVATSPETRFGYHDMTRSWIATLQARGYAPEVFTYRGYEGKPAERGEYIFDILREFLIFHSESFEN